MNDIKQTLKFMCDHLIDMDFANIWVQDKLDV